MFKAFSAMRATRAMRAMRAMRASEAKPRFGVFLCDGEFGEESEVAMGGLDPRRALAGSLEGRKAGRPEGRKAGRLEGWKRHLCNVGKKLDKNVWI